MRVLIAEDDAVTRRVLVSQLRSWGYQPMAVADGNAALEVLEAVGGPSIAILDWDMPGLAGIEVCWRIRQFIKNRYVYVLLLSGKDGHEHVVAGLDGGADDYVTKPFDNGELAARLRVAERVVALQDDLARVREELRAQTVRDALTGVLNRRGVMSVLAAESQLLDPNTGSLGVVMLDIDYFKVINDSCGHATGDRVLQEVAMRLAGSVRAGDHLGRLGGEEFLMVLPGCTRRSALAVAERARARLDAEPFVIDGHVITVTCSAGVSVTEDAVDPQNLVECADRALYRAKSAGRNRVCEERPPEQLSRRAQEPVTTSAPLMSRPMHLVASGGS